MYKKLLVLAIITLFSLPTYAAAQCCCCQSGNKQAQSQNSSSKEQTGCPAPAVATGAEKSQNNPVASPKDSQDQMLSQKPEKSGPEKN